ncbi:MAG: hypothetical protein MI749_22340 [Desulfovibrionales bacterium]|nr:hypothetical protein [Desulfovibrionales bacterium]
MSHHVKHQRDVCYKFLQMKYHTEGEFLPDRFDFEPLQCRTLVIGDDDQQVVADDDSSQSTDSGKFCANDPEEQDRVMAAMAMEKVMLNDPFKNSIGTGPRKFLGVVKPIILYQQMCLWCDELQHHPIPSFSSFLRALKEARPWLRFRKSAGQHGLCDSCCWYKTQLKKHCTSKERVAVMEQYAQHLLQVWRDRQMENALHAQACHTRQAILEGTHASTLSNSVTCFKKWFVIVC